tara:strand:- start:327 stop:815 length:489 start_codon:yes stop_codon:yes gene_type:complete
MSYLIETRKIHKIVTRSDSSASETEISDTIVEYPNTQIEYACPAGATKIIIKINFQISWVPDQHTSYSCSRLQYSENNGVTWNTIAGTQLVEGNFSSSNGNDWHNYFHMYSLNAWSGTRKFRVAGRSYTSGQEFTCSPGYQTNPSNLELSGSTPHISIFSIM